jgi:hypothetical protein
VTFSRRGVSDNHDDYVLSVSDIIEPAGEKSRVVEAGTAANLIRVDQRFSDAVSVFGQQVWMLFGYVLFSFVGQFDFALQIRTRE